MLGPKSPGLMILEHEINELQVAAFIDAFPMIAQNGWRFESLAQLYPDYGGPYQNAESNNSSDVVPQGIIEGNSDDDDDSSSTTASTDSSTSADSAPTSTSSGSADSQTGLADGSKGNSGMMAQPAFGWSVSVGLVGLFAGGLLM